MIWNDKNTVSGQLVASQTSSGDYKDLHIISGSSGNWSLVSLQDGYRHDHASKDELIDWMNKHHHTPLVKIFGTGPMPENRAGLPAVQITGLRHSP